MPLRVKTTPQTEWHRSTHRIHQGGRPASIWWVMERPTSLEVHAARAIFISDVRVPILIKTDGPTCLVLGGVGLFESRSRKGLYGFHYWDFSRVHTLMISISLHYTLKLWRHSLKWRESFFEVLFPNWIFKVFREIQYQHSFKYTFRNVPYILSFTIYAKIIIPNVSVSTSAHIHYQTYIICLVVLAMAAVRKINKRANSVSFN